MIFSSKFYLIKIYCQSGGVGSEEECGTYQTTTRRKVPIVNQHLRTWSRSHMASPNYFFPYYSSLVKGNCYFSSLKGNHEIGGPRLIRLLKKVLFSSFRVQSLDLQQIVSILGAKIAVPSLGIAFQFLEGERETVKGEMWVPMESVS